MGKEQWIHLGAPLNKVGNSFSVRIPMHIVKELGAEEGHILAMRIRRFSLAWSPEIMDQFFRVARQCRELDSFSDDKIVLLSRLAFNEGKSLMESMDMKYREDRDAALKASKALKDYRGHIKKEFGTKIFDEFLRFRKAVDPKLEKMNTYKK